MKTFMASPSTIERKWYVVDATDMTLGRLASEVAKVLRGKNKAIFTPFIDTGDYVIVVNAEKIKVTGKKLDQKIYYHHSDYVGGMKETSLRDMLNTHPERVIEHAERACFQRDHLVVRCTQSFSYMLDQSTSSRHRSQKCLHFNRR